MVVDPQIAQSADGTVKVTVLHDGKLTVHRKGSTNRIYLGRWSGFGHHQQVVISGDGSAFAIYDCYAGMEIFNGKGKKIALLLPRLLLSEKELKNVPGKWTCHPEGTWLKNPTFTFMKSYLEFTVYNGRKVRVDL